jgi:hypothetical protein
MEGFAPSKNGKRRNEMKTLIFIPLICFLPYLCNHKLVSNNLNYDVNRIQERWGCKLDKIEKIDEDRYVVSYHDTIFTYLYALL